MDMLDHMCVIIVVTDTTVGIGIIGRSIATTAQPELPISITHRSTQRDINILTAVMNIVTTATTEIIGTIESNETTVIIVTAATVGITAIMTNQP